MKQQNNNTKGGISTATILCVMLGIIILIVIIKQNQVSFLHSDWTRQDTGTTIPVRNPSSDTPSITLFGNNPDSRSFNGISDYRDPGYSATDREDGDITSRVMYSDEVKEENPNQYCSSQYYLRTYAVSDSDGNKVSVQRKITGNTQIRDCAAPPIEDIKVGP